MTILFPGESHEPDSSKKGKQKIFFKISDSTGNKNPYWCWVAVLFTGGIDSTLSHEELIDQILPEDEESVPDSSESEGV